jgi:hypothetical protein
VWKAVPGVGGFAGDRQVPRGAQAERRPPETLGGLVVRRLGEPPGEHAEVRRAIRPSRAPLVEQTHRVDELLDRGHGSLPQQAGL